MQPLRIVHYALSIAAVAAFAASAAAEVVVLPDDQRGGDFAMEFDARFAAGAPRDLDLRLGFAPPGRPDADRARILRAQIFKAANAYKAEKVARTSGFTGGQESVFDFWRDPELGDPEFYEAVVRPLEERLDKGLEKVKVGMSDEDVRDVAQNYLQEWRDVRFTVDRLRAAYLNERLLEEGR